MPQSIPPFYCTQSARATCHIFPQMRCLCLTQSIYEKDMAFHEAGMTSQDQFKIRKIERARNNRLI
eukprot:scaffold2747_cov104-Cylindrotheca_fusiformis.AAC.10